MTAIDLDDDEALVIFEFLSRYQESGQLTVAHPGEDQALANLLCLLEKQLVAPFSPADPHGRYDPDDPKNANKVPPSYERGHTPIHNPATGNHNLPWWLTYIYDNTIGLLEDAVDAVKGGWAVVGGVVAGGCGKCWCYVRERRTKTLMQKVQLGIPCKHNKDCDRMCSVTRALLNTVGKKLGVKFTVTGECVR